MNKTIVISGATGFIGRSLCNDLSQKQFHVVALTRNPDPHLFSPDPVEMVYWDGKHSGNWVQHIDGAFGIINLSGENIAVGRWTKKKKQKLIASRLDSTGILAQAVAQVDNKPRVFLQVSGIGFYGNRGDLILDENSPPGSGFLAELCQKWEAAAEPVKNLNIRLVIMRTGMVLGPNGGMLKNTIPPFQFHFGSVPGSGDNWYSWIHIKDYTRAVSYLLDTPDSQGIFNLTAPTPVRAREFFATLGKTLNRKAWLTVPAAFLRLALGKMADELILASQNAGPKKLRDAGFTFRYEELTTALTDILHP
ncbi:MAG: TIGR01777 family oxidoreductase [Sedimentisphaerales bacterium]|nr:TIGR01777 family oxidoreductase [Sedimentisphaerales bacterium]